jgi:glycosyltransferase involved in cell wall biosynthesis
MNTLDSPLSAQTATDSTTPSTVLLITPLWSRNGGVAAHVQASATALARHGLTVRVLAAEIDRENVAPGVSVLHSPELMNSHIAMDARIGEALSSGPDLVHLHQVDDPDLVAAARKRAPVVISAHGYTACTSGVYYFRPGETCTRAHGLACIPNLTLRGCWHSRDPRPLSKAYRRATRGLEALRQADLAVAYSSAVDRHLAANGIARRCVLPLFSTMQTKRVAPHAGRRRVVFAGRIVAAKGVDTLIRAAREVEAEFVLCGDGWQLPAMRRLAQRLGVQARIDFRGWLAAEELAQELADASVVVVPSRWPEPFGLVGIEALAAGRPVIASATGGISDWLKDGVCGLSVPPADAPALARALRELLDDPQRQHAMGAAGREIVAARFCAGHHVAALLESYRAAREHWSATSEALRGAGQVGEVDHAGQAARR